MTAAPIRLQLVHDDRLCYAMQQNGVAPVQLLQLHNDSAEELRDLEVRIELLPDLGTPWVARIAAIPAGGTYNLDRPKLIPRPEVLANTTEQQRANLRVEVRRADELLLAADHEVLVLAYNEWPGARSWPALLAAFVLPNHPAIAEVLRAAAERLQASTGNGALDGYQSRDAERARAIAAAIWSALQGCAIAYVHPPASFEQQGQKVRTPDQVLGERLGTCLDLAVLYAACLEQAGLHALVAVVDGHAVAGAWLVPETFAEPAPTEPLPLKKRIELDRLLLAECTLLCASQAQPFASACAIGARVVQGGEANGADANESRAFLFALDVAAARRAGIKPLPLRVSNFTAVPIDEVPAAEPAPLTPTPVPLPQAPRSAPAATDRLGRWQRRLLDLTLRNRLLAFAPSKRTIPLSGDDLSGLVEALAGGAEFSLQTTPQLEATALPAYLRGELGHRRLCAPLADEELERRQLEIWRAARTAHEESGVNTLFLALGFLRWYETPTTPEPRRAPLLLLPLRIERVSLAEGFVVALADEDGRVNDTLVQKLQHDFALRIDGLDAASDDEDGLDPAAVLDAFRRAIVDVERWEVEPTACIGTFSFAKYQMWADLGDRRDEILAQPFLRHLIETPQQAYAQPDGWPEDRELDRLAPDDLLCPKDADSSQLVAVQAAAQGRSFVLEGPPGTGKSQTITNLIAQNLAQGRRVLFVAEKRAALEVVQRRLAEVGLAPFCLELHSGRGSKKDVIQQLGRALQLAGTAEPAQWAQRCTQLTAAREQLNALVRALHRPRGPGCSVFEAIARVIELRSQPLVAGVPCDVDADGLQQRRDAVDALAATAQPIGALRTHPWWGVRLPLWQPDLPRELTPLLAASEQAVDALRPAARAAAQAFALADPIDASRERLQQLAELAQQVLDGPLPPLVAAADFAVRRTTIAHWLSAGHKHRDAWSELRRRWSERLLQLDVVDLRTRLLLHEPKFALLRWWHLRPVRKALAAAALAGQLPRGKDLHRDLETAATVRTLQGQLERADADGRAWLGALWRGVDTDWTAVARVLERCERIRELAGALAADGGAAAVLQRCAELAAEPAGAAARALAALVEAQTQCSQALQALAQPLQLDVDAAFGGAAEPAHLARTAAWLRAAAGALPRLREWCALQRDAQAAAGLGLRPLVQALEDGACVAAALRPVFERSFAEALLRAVLQQEPLLAQFRGLDHARAIDRFRALDRELIALSGEVVRARLCAALPALRSTTAESSELGVLLRELKKQRRHLSSRQLFQRLPNLLQKLAPCLLMSPLSVAQVLARGLPPFDLVVFDEASQVPVWDAVGAMLRGKALVVVGDSRQLPPTAFFQRLDDGDDDERGDENDVQVDELESVLDECAAAGLQRLHLRWHYRSQHESLIAFSNHHYYDNRLFTFPAPDRGGALGVRLVPVAGVYDRSRARQNRIEAEALVNALVARLRDPEQSRWSHGVVTFSQPQQTLVEDLLEQARAQYPEIERFFGGDGEPVFVKNLENVQGDERDVMLFSICYGPDAAGKVYMSFGPLNLQGGERRLNVAITRARRELLVFSSLRAEQIELQRTQALGVRHLRAFLDYAARGVQAITEAVALDPSRDCETPFERAVRAALAARGHEVHAQVGCSGYRIDLAIVDPRAKGRYLLGVECDGASYHSAATARDRDRLRQGVLERLGWSLHRVWSTDWWHDEVGELQRLDAAIAQALERPVAVAPPPPAAPIAAVDGAVGKTAGGPAADAVAGAVPPRAAASASAAPTPSSPAPAPASPELPRYVPATLPPAGDAAAFARVAANAAVREQIAAVIAAEAPLAFELLVRRVADAWSIGRITEKVRDRVRAQLPTTAREVDDVVWAAGQDPAAFAEFRTSPPGAAARDADLLPAIEVQNAMLWLLRQHGSLAADDLLRETAKLFGIARLGSSVRAAMGSALTALIARGAALRDGEVVRAG